MLDSQTLIAAGRQLETPFEVQVKLLGEAQSAQCTQLLRLVPGRRVVVKMQLGSSTYLAKIFLGSERHKYCRREQSGIMALQGAGVSTAKLVGHGCLVDDGAEVLLLDYLPQAQQLSALLTSRKSDTDNQLRAAVEMMAALHERGLRHKDCHLDNFLVSDQRLYLIDGDAVEQTSSLSQALALQNLALFFVQLPLLLTPRITEFFEQYCAQRGWPHNDCLPLLQGALKSQRDSRQRRFLKKVFRDCTAFNVIKSSARFVVRDRQEDCPELQALIANPDHYIATAKLLKDGRSATVAKVCLGEKSYVVKRYNIKSVVHWMTRFWRPSRAWISWRNAQFLCFYDINTPKPLAMIEQRFGALRGKAYFITEHVAADDALGFAEKFKTDLPALTNMAYQFAELFDVMKQLRFSHGDFKATNFLLDDGVLRVIDLDSMALHSTQQSHDTAFAKDQQRFMKNWCADEQLKMVMAKALQDNSG